MATPTLTVVMAHSGTEADGSKSVAGHMYYVLADANGNQYSYGLSPLAEHSLYGAGHVYTNDNTKYANLTYATDTVNLTQNQFNTLLT